MIGSLSEAASILRVWFERLRPRGTVHVNMASGLLVHKGRIFIQKRLPDDVWAGLWEFPGGVIEKGETPEQALRREFVEEVALEIRPVREMKPVSHVYGRHLVTLHCFFCVYENGFVEPELKEAVEGEFVTPGELLKYEFPAGHARLLRRMRRNCDFQAFL